MTRCKLHLLASLFVGVLGCTRAGGADPQHGNDPNGGGPMAAKYTEAWSLRVDPIVSRTDWASSVATDDVILLMNADGVIGIDATSGKIRWTGKGRHVHPPGQVQPLYRIGDLPVGFATLSEVTQVDPRDGRQIEQIPLEKPISGSKLQVDSGDGVLLVHGNDHGAEQFTAFDPATGKVRWSRPVTDTPIAPFFLPGMFIMSSPYRAISLVDGRTLWSMEGACCDVASTSDGARIYLRKSDDPVAFTQLDRNGKPVRDVPGRLLGVTDTHLAVDTGAALKVFTQGKEAPVAEFPYPEGHPYSAVALAKDALYYFNGADATLWRQNLSDGARTAVVKLTKSIGFSTEKAEVLKPSLSLPPESTGARVYVMETWTLRAFDFSTPAR